MGNHIGESGSPLLRGASAQIHHYYSPEMWIEGEALNQLNYVANLPGVQAVAAFPDLHPGKYGPAGVAVLSKRLHPQLIGNDIGCGMSLFELDFPAHKLRFDRAVERLRSMEEEPLDAEEVASALEEAGLPVDLHPAALGSIGGGNHFCEVQAVESLFDGANRAALNRQNLHLLVHSGSRALGAEVFGRVLAIDGAINNGLDPEGEGAAWLIAHDQAMRWASLNRRMIAQRAANALRCDVRERIDTPHNIVRRVEGGFVHHKGAAWVTPGGLAPVAGSRASLSYVVAALPGVVASFEGVSHGAGRRYDRASMHGRVGRTRTERDALIRNEWGGHVICDDRSLMIEEAASAYKDAGHVVRDLEAAGLAKPVAAMKPLITFKRAKAGEGPAGPVRHRPRRAEDRRLRHERD